MGHGVEATAGPRQLLHLSVSRRHRDSAADRPTAAFLTRLLKTGALFVSVRRRGETWGANEGTNGGDDRHLTGSSALRNWSERTVGE